MTTSRYLRVLPLLSLAAPVPADHGGSLASAPMSPSVVAVAAGGLAFVADAGDTAVAPDDPALLPGSTPGLGRYTARFGVPSVDGHVVESSLAFTVKAALR